MTGLAERKSRVQGRPAFAPTSAMRRRVSVAAGGGMTHESIAVALGISTPTLRKHFEAELAVGARQRRVDVLSALYTAAKKGSVSAAKAYLANEPELTAPPAEGSSPKPADAPAPAAKVGKKVQAQADADIAATGSDWGPLLTRVK